MNKVFNPTGKELNSSEIAEWANAVHRQAGGKGNPFTSKDYEGENSRISGGGMCYCNNEGVFHLLPLNDECVLEGGKAYMECKKCNAFSHL